jgi:hypothetical protein
MSANRGKTTNFQQVRFGARKEVSMDAECGLKFPANPHNAESTNIGIEERLHLARESAAGLLAMWLETLEEGHHILPDFSTLQPPSRTTRVGRPALRPSLARVGCGQGALIDCRHESTSRTSR